MAFNPILETNIQPTQAVQKPSAAGAAVNLLGGLFPERAAPPTPSRADVTDSFRQETLRAMETARQAGDTAGINNAYRNWSVQQGVGTAPEIDSAFEAYTGRSPMIATTGGDTSISSIESNPSYPLYFEMARGENPDASPDDLRTAALGMTSAKMANDAKVEAIKNSQTVNWTQAQVEYDKGFNIALGELNNMITQYNADSILTPDEAKVIRDYFNTYASKFTAPMGVPAETFEQYRKTKWDAMTNLVDTQLNYILRDGSSKDMQKAMSNIIAKLTSQGRLSPMTEYAVNMGGANGDAVATILNIYKGVEENTEWTDTLKQINKMSFDELVEFSKSFEEMGPENLAAKVDTSTWVGQSDAKKIDSLTLADKAMIISTDPLQATLGVQATVEKVNSLGATSLDGKLLATVFDASYMSALERIKAKNPALGEYFIARTTEVLKAQQSAMLNNINTVATTNGFRAQTVNGRTEFVPDPNLMSDAAKAEVQKYFGGDWQRAWDANGLVMNPSGRGSGEVLTPALRMSFDQIKKIKGSLDQYAAVMATVDRIAGVEPRLNTATNMAVDQNISTDYGDSSTPEWQTENLTTIQATNGQKWQVNKQAAAAFQGLIAELESMGYAPVSSGGYNYRNIRGSNRLSEHATGNAIDINATANPMGGKANDLPPNISEIAARHGLIWGGDWKGRPDPMHFEFAAGRMGNSSANPPAQGDVAERPFAVAQNNFSDMANANMGQSPLGASFNAPVQPFVTPSANSTGRPTPEQGTERILPPELGKVSGSEQAAATADRYIPSTKSKSVREFVESITKFDLSKVPDFNTHDDLISAIQDGVVQPGDVVKINGVATVVPEGMAPELTSPSAASFKDWNAVQSALAKGIIKAGDQVEVGGYAVTATDDMLPRSPKPKGTNFTPSR